MNKIIHRLRGVGDTENRGVGVMGIDSLPNFIKLLKVTLIMLGWLIATQGAKLIQIGCSQKKCNLFLKVTSNV